MGGSPLTAVLLDTHVWAWTLTDDPRISEPARRCISEASEVFVSAISFFEIAQKVWLGKWPEMESYLERLRELLDGQRASAASLEAADCQMAGTLRWPHRDPFDRLLAASALRRGVPIVSADVVFDALLARIW